MCNLKFASYIKSHSHPQTFLQTKFDIRTNMYMHTCMHVCRNAFCSGVIRDHYRKMQHWLMMTIQPTTHDM